MSHERLKRLTMISIENEYLDKLDFDNLIEEFILKNTRRVIFFESYYANYKYHNQGYIFLKYNLS